MCLCIIYSIKCSDNAIDNAGKALSEIFRVLKPLGSFISISHSSPELRLPQLEAVNY